MSFVAPKIDAVDIDHYGIEIKDNDYFLFLKEVSNGGFFFDRSLHLYGFCTSPNFHSIAFINQFIHHEFGVLTKGNIFFGQDIFGNQFSFTQQGITLFNIETSESDFLAANFSEWLKVLEKDLDYLTGYTFLKKWEIENKVLEYNQRLCAKKPFVIGGVYESANLYAQYFPTYISSNANIARQVKEIPDGSEIRLKIV